MKLDRLGLIKTSLLDYPGRVAAVVFTRGCNLRCPWCQNPELVVGPPPTGWLSRGEVLAVLERRRKVLGGVVVTGGEPLWHQDLPLLLEDLGSLGYPVKLDTNGTFPERLSRIRADFVAMDLKMAPRRYDRLGLPGLAGRVLESIGVIRARFARHEFRTTWVPGFNEIGDLELMAKALGSGATLTLRGFRPGRTLDEGFAGRAPSDGELHEVAARLGALGVTVNVDIKMQHTLFDAQLVV